MRFEGIRWVLAVGLALAGVAHADTAPPTGEKPGGRVVVRRDRLEILDPILFETGKAVIKPVSYGILDAIAAALKGHSQLVLVEVQGHTDERGQEVYNAKITEDRAQSVKRYLVAHGTDAGRLQAHGYGETQPVCAEHNEACWSKNRRIDFVILKRSDVAQ